MAQTFDVDGPAATPREALNLVKVRDEISRLSQRLARARASYEIDLVRGEGDVPLDAQLATIETYVSKLDALHEQLRLHEGGAAPQTGPQAVALPMAPAAVLPAPAPVPAAPPLPHRAPPQHLATAPQNLAAAFQPFAPATQPSAPWPLAPQAPAPQPLAGHHLAPSAAPAPRTVFQPEPEPSVLEEAPALSGPTPQVERTFDTDGNTLISDATLRSEEVATGEYVRLAAEQRWLATHRPSLVDEYTRACDLILEVLAHWHGTTPETERERLGRQVDARFRRDYG